MLQCYFHKIIKNKYFYIITACNLFTLLLELFLSRHINLEIDFLDVLRFRTRSVFVESSVFISWDSLALFWRIFTFVGNKVWQHSHFARADEPLKRPQYTNSWPNIEARTQSDECQGHSLAACLSEKCIPIFFLLSLLRLTAGRRPLPFFPRMPILRPAE